MQLREVEAHSGHCGRKHQRSCSQEQQMGGLGGKRRQSSNRKAARSSARRRAALLGISLDIHIKRVQFLMY